MARRKRDLNRYPRPNTPRKANLQLHMNQLKEKIRNKACEIEKTAENVVLSSHVYYKHPHSAVLCRTITKPKHSREDESILVPYSTSWTNGCDEVGTVAEGCTTEHWCYVKGIFGLRVTAARGNEELL
ncbi:hypothetical protein CBL_01811 [Carabus blaptoides fortunei]